MSMNTFLEGLTAEQRAELAKGIAAMDASQPALAVPPAPAPLRIKVRDPETQREYILVVKAQMVALDSAGWIAEYYRWTVYPDDPEHTGAAENGGNIPLAQSRSADTAKSWALTACGLTELVKTPQDVSGNTAE